jgi:3,4-dihydroxy 2-butanone 4-phosphate synthase/GTP cyclohydrolase II
MFDAVGYRSLIDGLEHLALVKGDLSRPQPVLVRVHTQCLVGDAFHGLQCDCGSLLERSMAAIEREGRGVFVHLAQRAHGLGWLWALADGTDASDRVAAEALRDVGVGAAILTDLGLGSICILTDHPHDIHALAGYGLIVDEQRPIGEPRWPSCTGGGADRPRRHPGRRRGGSL